jgi:SAM-dependent methyltransferase
MNDPVSNLFVEATTAERYAAARPYFHPLVADRIVAFTGSPRFGRALDAACGTGQSARGIAEICDRVEAVDISPEMIAAASPHERVHYQVATAERLPFPERDFDLITVGLAFHWFDQAAFLREARRVLKPGGWLVIYNNAFTGEMRDDAAFQSWGCKVYPQRFPAPARHSVTIDDDLLTLQGLKSCGTASFTTEELMTAQELTAYLMTQTNVLAATQRGKFSIAAAAEWIESGVKPYFKTDRAAMKFRGKIIYIRRVMEDRRGNGPDTKAPIVTDETFAPEPPQFFDSQ